MKPNVGMYLSFSNILKLHKSMDKANLSDADQDKCCVPIRVLSILNSTGD